MSRFTVFLAGDSTVQSYRREVMPIAGWGQLLHTCFLPAEQINPEGREGCDWMGCGHGSASGFAQAVSYETKGFCIDNRAMAGRSSRSYFDEGRLEDLEKSMQPGDYLFLQFAHNDANREKKERYVTTEQYAEYLLRYVRACEAHGVQPVFVTAIAMRNCGDYADGRFHISFPAYREKMMEVGAACEIPVLDLGKITTEYLNTLDPEQTKQLYLWVEPGRYPDGPYAVSYTHLRAHET